MMFVRIAGSSLEWTLNKAGFRLDPKDVLETTEIVFLH